MMEDLLADIGVMDLAFFAVIAISTILALANGFIATILSLLTWVASIGAAYFGLEHIRPFLEDRIESTFAVSIIGYTILFLGTFIVLTILNAWIIRLARSLRMGMLDRTLGAAFGFIRGAAICVFFIFMVLFINSLLIGIESKPEKEEGIRRYKKPKIEKPKKKIRDLEPLWLQNSITYSYSRDFIMAFLEQTQDVAAMKNLLLAMQGKLGADMTTGQGGVNEEEVVKKVAALLNPAVQQQIVEKYRTNQMSEEQKIQLSLAILSAYRNAVMNGEVPKDKQVAPEVVDAAVLQFSRRLNILELEKQQREILEEGRNTMSRLLEIL